MASIKSNIYETWTIKDQTIEMGIIAVGYIVLYFYLDLVIPNEYGVSKHPFFFIMDCFRSGKKENMNSRKR